MRAAFAVVLASIAATGSPAKPVPLHNAAAVGGGWTLRIDRVVGWDVSKQVGGVPGRVNAPTPPAAQDVLLAVTVTFKGAGQADLHDDLADRVFVEGSHRAPYVWDSGHNGCGPMSAHLPSQWNKLQNVIGGGAGTTQVYSGTTLHGYACFQIARNDAKTLRLGVASNSLYGGITQPKAPIVWFSLR